MTIRVLIADDHRLFRQGLRSLLEAVGDIIVVGEASDGNEAVTMARQLTPDVVLIDLHMPAGGGIGAVKALAAQTPPTRCLVVTMFDDDESVFNVLRAGALGYVLKDADESELLRAVSTVAAGGATYGAAVAARISESFNRQPDRPEPETAFPTLTASERRVLEHLARGLNNDAIASVLGYSPKTVRNYVSIIFAKLHVTDRAQAITTARDRGIGQHRPGQP